MKKIELIALLTDSKNIIELLQNQGLVEIESYEKNELIKADTQPSIRLFEKHRDMAKKALAVLNETTRYKAQLNSLIYGKKKYDIGYFGEKSAVIEPILRVCDEILLNDRKIDELSNEIRLLSDEIEELENYEKFDLPLDFSGTDETICFVGKTADLNGFESFYLETESLSYVERMSEKSGQISFAVICHNEEKERVVKLLRNIGFLPLSLTGNEKPRERIKLNRLKINENEKLISKYRQKTAKLEPERENIEFIIDYLSVRCDKYKALGEIGMSDATFMLKGYIPEKYAEQLISKIERKYIASVSIYDPSETDDVPVMLENSAFSSPVESITEMYSLPAEKDIDPTGIMAFFYYLFFGLMLSDAGYGAAMVILTSLALKKLKLSEKMRQTMRMFLYSGISTVFWGALFGSWFGDLPQTVAKQFFNKDIGSLALWFEPLSDPIKLLIFCFGLGIVHLFWGLAVHGFVLWKNGEKSDAFFDTIPIYLLVSGAAPLAAGILVEVSPQIKTVGKYFLIIGAVFTVLISLIKKRSVVSGLLSGLYALYNTATGYLSDILSYSRLLALGLATGSIASVINLIGTMPDNKALKALMFLIVFIVGHTANIAVNLLGAYVHTDRLQFVELFSKFYVGGGRKFEPFALNTKYIELEGEE